MSADSRGASNCEEGGLGDCFGEYTVFEKYQKMGKRCVKALRNAKNTCFCEIK